MLKPPPIPNVRTLSLCLMLGAAALTGCAPKRVTLIAPPSTLEPCVSPDPSSVTTLTEMATHSIAQEAVIQACEAKRKALASLITGKQ